MAFPPNVYVGTSGWTYPDWLGSFYPADSKPQDLIQHYARSFRAVELDSTYSTIPARAVVAGWKENTPPGFVFAAQVPGVITHQKVMKDCQRELTTFLNSLELLRRPPGPAAASISLLQPKCFRFTSSVRQAAAAIFENAAKGISVCRGDTK